MYCLNITNMIFAVSICVGLKLNSSQNIKISMNSIVIKDAKSFNFSQKNYGLILFEFENCF